MIGRTCAVVIVFGRTCRFVGSGGGAPPPRWPPPPAGGAWAAARVPARAATLKAPTMCLKRSMLAPLQVEDKTLSLLRGCTIPLARAQAIKVAGPSDAVLYSSGSIEARTPYLASPHRNSVSGSNRLDLIHSD